MNIAVRYYTISGNTKKLADAVAASVNVTAEDISVDLSEKADILFLGSSLYGGGYEPSIEKFIEENVDKIGVIVNFGSSVSGKSTFYKIKALAEEKGITVFDEFFNCPGRFLLIHRKRPNDTDLRAVSSFAKAACAKLSGK
ncbi:MAG: flavodoxin [Lachnospiraceae bacterium]|nr:flavodoxin [Lachnospiraceae bacterium]